MTVKNVIAAGKNEEGAWIVAYDDLSAHGFPPETLFWRAAEYGVDPTDVETLLEIVLHEPHVGLQHTDPTFLYNTDQDTARRAHLDRVAKSPVRVQDPHGHLGAIRQAHQAAYSPDLHLNLVAQVAAIRSGRGSARLAPRH